MQRQLLGRTINLEDTPEAQAYVAEIEAAKPICGKLVGALVPFVLEPELAVEALKRVRLILAGIVATEFVATVEEILEDDLNG